MSTHTAITRGEARRPEPPRHLCFRGSVLMEGIAIDRQHEDEARRRVMTLYDGGPVRIFMCAGRAFYYVSFLAPRRQSADAIPGIPFVRTRKGLASYQENDFDERRPALGAPENAVRLRLYLGGVHYDETLGESVDVTGWFDFGSLLDLPVSPVSPPSLAEDALPKAEVDLRKVADVPPPVLDLAELLERIRKGDDPDPVAERKRPIPLAPIFVAVGALGLLAIVLSPWELPWGAGRTAIVFVAALLLVATLWRLSVGPKGERTSNVPTLANTFGAIRSIVTGGRRSVRASSMGGASEDQVGGGGPGGTGALPGDAGDHRWLWAARLLLLAFVIALATQIPLPEGPSLGNLLRALLLGCLYLALIVASVGLIVTLLAFLLRPFGRLFGAWFRQAVPNPRRRARWVSHVFLGVMGIGLLAFMVLRPWMFLAILGIFALVALVLYLLEKIPRRPRTSPAPGTGFFGGQLGWGVGLLALGIVLRSASRPGTTRSIAPLLSIGAVVLIYALVHRDRASQPAGATGQPGAPQQPPPATRPGLLSRFLPKLLADLGLLSLLERRQNAYVSNLFRMLEDGDVHEALRHAIPLSNEVKTSLSGKRGMLSWLAPRSEFVMGAKKQGGEASSLLFEPDLFEGLKKKYRSLFERLDRQGDIEKAAFVLAELLQESEEAVAYLEKHKRTRLAAELAEGRDLRPGLQLRLWFLAGDKRRALRIALKSGALMEAVHELERTGAPEAQELRILWADKLAEAGSWIEAVDVLWLVEGSRHIAIDWIDRGIALGGLPGARMLAKKIELLSDPRFIETELKSERFAKLLATTDPAKAPKAIQNVLFEEIRTQTSHLLAEGQWATEPLVAFSEELLRIPNSHSAKVLARLVSRRLISECVKELEIEAFAPSQSKRASNLAKLRDKMLLYSGDLALKHDAKNVVRAKREGKRDRPRAQVSIAVCNAPRGPEGRAVDGNDDTYFVTHLRQPDARTLLFGDAEEGIVCGFFRAPHSTSAAKSLDEATKSLLEYAPSYRTTKESWAWCMQLGFHARPYLTNPFAPAVVTFFEDWLIFEQRYFRTMEEASLLYVLRDGGIICLSKPGFFLLQRGDRILLSDEYSQSSPPPDLKTFASALKTHEVLAQLVKHKGILIDVSGPTLPATGVPLQVLDYVAEPTENPAASRSTPLDAREESLEITRGANDIGTIPATDAFQSSDGRIVVALGELGLRVYQRERDHTYGDRIAFDVRTPASDLIPSDNGDRCIVIHWIRSGLARLSRLDLQTGECSPWTDAEIDAYANTYDGKLWYVSKGDTVFAMDVQAKRWTHVWKVSEPSGHVHAISRNTRSLSFLMSSPMGTRRVIESTSGTNIVERERDKRLETWVIELPAHTLRARTEASAPPDAGLPIGQDGDPERWRRSLAISPEGNIMTYNHRSRSNYIIAFNHAAAWSGLEKDERAGLVSDRASRDDRWIAFTAKVERDLLVHIVDRAQTSSRAYFRLEGTDDASIRLQSEVLVTSDPKGRVIVFSLRTGQIIRELRIR